MTMLASIKNGFHHQPRLDDTRHHHLVLSADIMVVVRELPHERHHQRLLSLLQLMRTTRLRKTRKTRGLAVVHHRPALSRGSHGRTAIPVMCLQPCHPDPQVILAQGVAQIQLLKGVQIQGDGNQQFSLQPQSKLKLCDYLQGCHNAPAPGE